MTLFSRDDREARIDAAFADAQSVSEALGDVEVPADISSWLGRLHTLIGVPFGYLVPAEDMLPPESIRFFQLDDNWTRALLDGAFSIGRDLTPDTENASANVDRATFETLVTEARVAAPLRQRTLAEVVPTDQTGTTAWTGFLLRSRVVTEYPGLGVNVYPKDGSPEKHTPLLPVRRLDRLGPQSDTLLCLVEGDAYRVDVHEAPELLHYGLDDYKAPVTPGGEPTATKQLRTFSRTSEAPVVFGPIVPVPVGSAFRTRSPRVIKFGDLATLIGQKNTPPGGPIDSAEMGFAMTQGVGMVSFERKAHA